MGHGERNREREKEMLLLMNREWNQISANQKCEKGGLEEENGETALFSPPNVLVLKNKMETPSNGPAAKLPTLL